MRLLTQLAFASTLLLVSAARAQHAGAPDTRPPPPWFEGLGDWTHRVTTKRPDAQRYFDQGLRLYYAFNHDEAAQSFRTAARVDPTCAMACWGVALSLGSNYNLEATAEQRAAACDAIDDARQLAAGASPAEQAYIEALATRYSRDESADRAALQQQFADAMGRLARQFPDDVDAAVLHAEARMVLRPWDLWTRDRQPQPGTEQIVADLEAVLQRSPRHAGAIHYYIHAVEASPFPERALPFADALGSLAPGAGHLVHMPSHIYLQRGDYLAAADANARAIAADEAYLAAEKPSGPYPHMYYPHNIHFMWWTLCTTGQSRAALAAADKLLGLLTEETLREMPMVEYFLPVRLATQVRFGHWEAVLAEPEPAVELRYLHGFWRYARGMALLRQGATDGARRELALLQDEREQTPEDLVLMRHAARHLLGIASTALEGHLAAQLGNHDVAVEKLRAAIELQDTLQDDEPPPWFYAVRQSLGAVLLEAGRPVEAEAAYRDDLRIHPRNGWSLYGLAEALRAQGREDEARALSPQFDQAWSRADVRLKGSVF